MANVPAVVSGAIAQIVRRRLWRHLDVTLPVFLRPLCTTTCTEPVSFLSEAFELKNAWDERLKSRILSKVDLESMFSELEHRFYKLRLMNAIDIDIFLNALVDDSFIGEAEEMIYKLRQSADTRNTLDSTPHAFIRLILQYKPNELPRILHDRLNYGIFPDNYTIVLIMNEYLRRNDLRNAAKVAVLPMLQEDYSHALTRHLSLYSLLRFIFSRQSWKANGRNQQTYTKEDDGEEIKVRVAFLRNPYFDDHFDLRKGEHLCGKSLVALSIHYDELPVCNSLRMLGFILHEKWERLDHEIKRLNELSSSTPLIFDDCLQLSCTLLEGKTPDEETPQEIIEKFPQFIENLKSIPQERRITDKSVLQYVEKIVRSEVERCEQSEMNAQLELFKTWDETRIKLLEKARAELRKEQLMKEIAETKDSLEKEEELLHYFDKADQIDVVIDKKLKQIENRKYTREVKGIEIETETYIPPEVKKRETS